MHRLFKLLVVEDGPELALAVDGPLRGLHLHLRLAHVRPALVRFVIIDPREPGLPPDPLTHGDVPSFQAIGVIIKDHVFKCPLRDVSAESEEG